MSDNDNLTLWRVIEDVEKRLTELEKIVKSIEVVAPRDEDTDFENFCNAVSKLSARITNGAPTTECPMVTIEGIVYSCSLLPGHTGAHKTKTHHGDTFWLDSAAYKRIPLDDLPNADVFDFKDDGVLIAKLKDVVWWEKPKITGIQAKYESTIQPVLERCPSMYCEIGRAHV